VVVENSGSATVDDRSGAGIGLRNVRRRLEICYGSAANLDLAFDAEKTTAEISIPLTPVATY
jgi:sensor histidine kinase YesM